MPPLSSTRGLVRRLNDPDHPVPAVVLMSLGSLVLFGAVMVALPSSARGTDAPIVDAAPLATTSTMLDGPTQLVLPLPSGDRHEVRTIVNHRIDGIDIGARMVNGEGLTVGLSEAGPRATQVRVSSTGIHRCGAYVGSLVLEATHPAQDTDLLVMDVRFAECSDEVSHVAMAPPSVNDTEPTWADEGRPPWEPAPVAVPPPPTEEQPTTAPTEDATSGDPDGGSGDGDGTEEASEPTPTDEPTAPEPTTEPEPEPTATTEPEPEPSATAEPEPSPTSTTDPEPESTQTTTTTMTASPSPSPTADGGSAGGTTRDG